MKEYKVLTFCVKETGRVQPLAWCKCEISKKDMRRLTKKFRNDNDFDGAVAFDWFRLYSTISEMKSALPELT
jgi:hypothetical protein